MRINRNLFQAALVSGLMFEASAFGLTPAGAGVAAPPATPAAPTITSTGAHEYVSGSATQLVGTPGRFTFSDPGSTVSGYYYGLFGASPNVFVPAGADGTATLALTPYNPSVLTISVEAVDASSNPSPTSSFVIETLLPPGNIATLAWWKLNGGHKTIAADSSGHGHVAPLSKDAAMTCPATPAPDGYRCSMAVTGRGGQARTGPALLPVVGANGNFTVSAWLNPARCAGTCVAVSEDASQTYEFALEYQRACTANGRTGPCWKFAVPAADDTSATVFAAASPPGSAKLGKWTQLTGVFNATHGTVTLYVNGALAGQVGGTGPSGAGRGRVRIGNLMPGGTAHDWNGRLSDVCAFYAPIEGADVTLLYKGDSGHPHNGCAAMFATYP